MPETGPDIVARVAAARHHYHHTIAVDGIDLSFLAGQSVALIGPDGVGKSTLLGLVAGAKRVQQGRVEALGADLSDASARAKVQPRMAYMPQGLGRNLYASLSVRENVAFFAALFGAAAEAKIDALLDAIGLAAFQDRLAGKLSGGMKQKLGLCCALVHDPDLLILDEPTTGVDPLSRRQFWDIVEQIRSARPWMTLIVATSYMEEAERFARVLLMQSGKIIADGAPGALMAEHAASSIEALFTKLTSIDRLVIDSRPPRFALPDDAQIAVEAEGLTRRYGSFTAVDAVSFKVRRGEIFGFLGSNGCGKTTTMKMLTGLLPASAGVAKLFGRPVDARDLETRRRVGYMSQGFSLYGELSVQQNFNLHANLFGIREATRAARINALLEQFDLTRHADATAGALPLGVRQRLSLAIAILHAPEILILDEPTSGVDPAARDSFWRELERLATEQHVTIFISTHFMAEAERCDRIAFMHAGRVLAQGAPEELREAQNAETLEEAFVTYMKLGGAGDVIKPRLPPTLFARVATSSQRFSFDRLIAVARREALELVREPVRLVTAFLGTLILAFAFGFGISFDVEGVALTVLDRDQTPSSRAYIEEFSSSSYFKLMDMAPDEAGAARALRTHKASLYLNIPPGFGRDLAARRQPQIAAWVDGAMPFRAETIGGYAEALHSRAIRSLTSPARRTPETYRLEPRFRYNQGFRSLDAIVPVMIGILLALIPAILTSLAVVREKELGSITNFYVTPVSRAEFLMGKQIPYITIAFLNFLILVFLAVTLFGLSIKGSLLALLLGGFLYVSATSAIGFVSSAMTKSQTAAVFGTVIVIMMPVVEFSGLMQPVASLEPAARLIGTLFPTSHFNQVSLGVFAKGRSFTELLPTLTILAAFWIGFLSLAIALLRKQET